MSRYRWLQWSTTWVAVAGLGLVQSPISLKPTQALAQGSGTTPTAPGGGGTTPTRPGGGGTTPTAPGGGGTTPTAPGGGGPTLVPANPNPNF